PSAGTGPRWGTLNELAKPCNGSNTPRIETDTSRSRSLTALSFQSASATGRRAGGPSPTRCCGRTPPTSFWVTPCSHRELADPRVLPHSSLLPPRRVANFSRGDRVERPPAGARRAEPREAGWCRSRAARNHPAPQGNHSDRLLHEHSDSGPARVPGRPGAGGRFRRSHSSLRRNRCPALVDG